MRDKAEVEGRDLLLIDTGDRVEGNGLYDASSPKGRYDFEIFKEQQIDVICTGNHELYKESSANFEYNTTIPHFKDNYLASNLDIYDSTKDSFVPMAPRLRKFTTKNGVRILAMGFLFDFVGNANNSLVQPVEKTIEEKWYQDAIRDRNVDLFLVIGHVPVRSPEFDAIFKSIRQEQWDTPIQFFGGHTHIRDYKKYDAKSVALESGRFMETIGFQSIDGISTGGRVKPEATLKFSRKYIDNNLYSFQRHSGTNTSTFHTEHGRNVSAAIRRARQSLDLDQKFGCAPQDLWMFRAEYPGKDNIYTWLEEEVLPDIVADQDRADKPRLAIVNTGGIRFDIFKGPFTKDSTYIVSPFDSGFRVINDVPYDKAKKIIDVLNKAGEILQTNDLDHTFLAPPEMHFARRETMSARFSLRSSEQAYLGTDGPSLHPGYTTKDDGGSDGDDTVHSKIPFYSTPNCIQASINPSNSTKEPDVIDVVYIEFIEPWVLLALRFLGLEFDPDDTNAYMDGASLTNLLANWVKENWDGNC
ncbi:MAG: hypothetical protein Q9160_006120 [Pyrenula sp. 1 TL-2023]